MTSFLTNSLSIAMIVINRQLLHDQTVSRNIWLNSYDYIVVGAGSAGCPMAKRLAELPGVNVLLLEAGGAQDAVSTDIPVLTSDIAADKKWPYTNVQQENAGLDIPGRMIPEPKGKVLGGTSTINEMIYNRGNRFDYDSYDYLYGARGWSYREVLPYFVKSENNSDLNLVYTNPGYHGTHGPVGVSSLPDPDKVLLILENIFHKFGFRSVDMNGANQVGTAFAQFTTKGGLRSSTSNAYLEPNPFPDRLHILANAFVTKILINRMNGRLYANGVQFYKNNHFYTVGAKREVIICAGSVNTPQLLMLSGIGPREHLDNIGIKVLAALPVGSNLSNHPYVPVMATINNASLTGRPALLDMGQLTQLYYYKSGPLSGRHVLSLYMSTSSNAQKDWPNILHGFIVVPNTNRVQTKSVLKFSPNIVINDSINIILNAIQLVRTQSRGTIRLASSDPFVYPLIDSQLLSDTQDFEDMVEAVKYSLFILESTQFSNYVRLVTVPLTGCELCKDIPIHKCDQYIRCYVRQTSRSAYHMTGTSRMGRIDRNDVVVDERCRVKYVDRLRVADSSLYPFAPNANTNAAAILAGEVCATIIKYDQDHVS